MSHVISVPNRLIPVFNSNHRYIVLYGGRGSGKSWTIALYLIIKALESKVLILCTREYQNTIKDSIHSLLAQTVERHKLDKFFDIQKSEISSINGSKFIFKGLSKNINEIKSTEGINYCWVEEAQSISRDSLDVLIPTIRKENSQIIFVFNLNEEDDPVYSEFVLKKRDNSLVININYYDNIYFPEVLKKEMEYDKEFNHDKYRHVWLGECKNISDSCVFKGKFSAADFDSPSDIDYYFGADWGFSNDPTCLVRCFIKDEYLYIDYEAYGVGVEIDEIKQLFSAVPGYDENLIRGDNERPDTISYLSRNGLNIKGVKKGKGSVEDGVEFIRSFKHIYIHHRCKHTLYEFENYSYKKDKQTNEVLNVIIDKDNHIIDSIRYALRDVRKGLTTIYQPSKISVNNLWG